MSRSFRDCDWNPNYQERIVGRNKLKYGTPRTIRPANGNPGCYINYHFVEDEEGNCLVYIDYFICDGESKGTGTKMLADLLQHLVESEECLAEYVELLAVPSVGSHLNQEPQKLLDHYARLGFEPKGRRFPSNYLRGDIYNVIAKSYGYWNEVIGFDDSNSDNGNEDEYDEGNGEYYEDDNGDYYEDDNGEYDDDGYDVTGRDRDGFDRNGFNIFNYNRDGFDINGYNMIGQHFTEVESNRRSSRRSNRRSGGRKMLHKTKSTKRTKNLHQVYKKNKRNKKTIKKRKRRLTLKK